MSSEAVYQHALEQVLQGTHMRLDIYGISDITTDQFHAEIKEWQSWRGSISQLLLYNMASPRKELRVYFFGERPSSITDDVLKTITGILKKFDIASFHAQISESELQIINLETTDVSKYAIEPVEKDETSPLLSDEEKTRIDALLSNSRPTDHIMDLEFVSTLLNVSKKHLSTIVHKSYTNEVDYISRKVPNPMRIPGQHGSNNYTLVLLSPDCFKRLCMKMTRKKKVEMVQAYLLNSVSKPKS